MSTLTKNIADTCIVGGTVATWLSGHLADLAAMAGLVYTIVRLFVEWPLIKARIKSYFK